MKNYAVMFVVREVGPDGEPLPEEAEDAGSLYVRMSEVVSQERLRDTFDRYRDAVCVTFGGDGARVVELVSCGTNKIAVIKAIREITGLGLKESKDLSESRPGTAIVKLTNGSDKAVAALASAGARVRVRPVRDEDGHVSVEIARG